MERTGMKIVCDKEEKKGARVIESPGHSLTHHSLKDSSGKGAEQAWEEKRVGGGGTEEITISLCKNRLSITERSKSVLVHDGKNGKRMNG